MAPLHVATLVYKQFKESYITDCFYCNMLQSLAVSSHTCYYHILCFHGGREWFVVAFGGKLSGKVIVFFLGDYSAKLVQVWALVAHVLIAAQN